jgi:peptidoglycan/LPS O-acetylase OafA/YrhL
MKNQSYMYPIVDFWRTLAVVLVVFTHTLLWWDNPILFGILEPSLLGSTGVAIFFVLTSYVLMMSLERLKIKSTNFYADFMIRRFFRIYLLSIATVIFYYYTKIPSYFDNVQNFTNIDVSINSFFQNILLIQNFTIEKDILSPLWSLPYEFQMYFLLPIIFVYITNTKRKWKAIFLFFILLLLFFVMKSKVDSVNEILHYFQIPDYAKWGLCFIPGVVAYYAKKDFKVKTISFKYIWTVVGLILFSRMFNYSFMIQVLSAILVGFTLVMFNEDFSPKLKKYSSIISQYSYGIYLTHMLAIYLGFELFGRTWGAGLCF